MKYNRLRLNNEESSFVKERYKQIDFNELMSLAEGMSTIRNIDMLLSSLDYDIEHKEFGDSADILEKEHYVLLCKGIRDKALYFRDHNGKNEVSGFAVDALCKRADEISNVAINEPIGKDIYKIDQAINYIRSIVERFDTKQKVWNIAVYLGTKLGELMLDEDLLNYGFDWDITGNKKYPVIIDADRSVSIDPIRFVYDKLRSDPSRPDTRGTCSDFYYRFLDQIKA